nr:unnamed protein product [Callosobruchus chinensis]
MKIALVDIQGFHLNNIFQPKQLTVEISGKKTSFLFKPAIPLEKINAKYQKSMRYVENYIHGIPYHTGHIEYSEMNKILKLYLLDNVDRIYVRGSQKAKFLNDKCEEIAIFPKIYDVAKYDGTEYATAKYKPDVIRCFNHDCGKFACSEANYKLNEKLLDNAFSRLTYNEKIAVKNLKRLMPQLYLENKQTVKGKDTIRKFNPTIYQKNDWICGCDVKNTFFLFYNILNSSHRKSIQKHNEEVTKNRHVLNLTINCVRLVPTVSLWQENRLCSITLNFKVIAGLKRGTHLVDGEMAKIQFIFDLNDEVYRRIGHRVRSDKFVALSSKGMGKPFPLRANIYQQNVWVARLRSL